MVEDKASIAAFADFAPDAAAAAAPAASGPSRAITERCACASLPPLPLLSLSCTASGLMHSTRHPLANSLPTIFPSLALP